MIMRSVKPFDRDPSMKQRSSGDFVYSVAIGMQPSLAEPFVASFRRHNPVAMIVLGVGAGEAPAWSDFAARWNVEIRETSRGWAIPTGTSRGSFGLAELATRMPWLRKLLLRGVGESTAERAKALARVSSRTARRFSAFYEWMQVDTPDRLLISDVRDVIFQADIFAQPDLWNRGVVAGEEDTRLRDNETNRMWMGYVGHDPAPFLDCPVTCCGVTFGPLDAMSDYLKGMIDTFFDAPVLRAGADTGAHNWLARSGKVRITTCPNGAGPIFTAGFVDERNARIEEGTLRNDDGNVIPIIHQDDRWSDAVQRRLSNLAGDEIGMPDSLNVT
jgi:hypothetical protein